MDIFKKASLALRYLSLIKGKGRMLVRKWGTEPVVRIMCESEDKTMLSKCVNIVKKSII